MLECRVDLERALEVIRAIAGDLAVEDYLSLARRLSRV